MTRRFALSVLLLSASLAGAGVPCHCALTATGAEADSCCGDTQPAKDACCSEETNDRGAAVSIVMACMCAPAQSAPPDAPYVAPFVPVQSGNDWAAITPQSCAVEIIVSRANAGLHPRGASNPPISCLTTCALLC